MQPKSSLTKRLRGLKSYLFGHECEQRASAYLRKKGFNIIAQNYKCKHGEIDIIARKKDVLHFIEVKSSKNYESEYYLSARQIARISNAAQLYASARDEFSTLDFCIDLIAINDDKINFIENIS